MWRMEDGDRVFTPEEWAAFRIGLEFLLDAIKDNEDGDSGLSETGLPAFDPLTSEQKIALLADITDALMNPAIPTPRHTAANESAIAAVFEQLRLALEFELEDESQSTQVRDALLATFKNRPDQPDCLPKATNSKMERWEEVLEMLKGRVFWDADFEMGDHFLDLPREESLKKLHAFGIDPKYFLVNPREPNAKELIAAKQSLARYLGEPVPNDDGLFPMLTDLYHDLEIGPCSQDEVEKWWDHPWVDVSESTSPSFDCSYETWSAHFEKLLPVAPMRLELPTTDGADSPKQSSKWIAIEQQPSGWVVRDKDGSYWVDALGNGWSDEPDEEMPALTFASESLARTAFALADQLYDERTIRREYALKQIDEIEKTN